MEGVGKSAGTQLCYRLRETDPVVRVKANQLHYKGKGGELHNSNIGCRPESHHAAP